jgi:hypothetical protein
VTCRSDQRCSGSCIGGDAGVSGGGAGGGGGVDAGLAQATGAHRSSTIEAFQTLSHGAELAFVNPDIDALFLAPVPALSATRVRTFPAGARPSSVSVRPGRVVFVTLRGTDQIARIDLDGAQPDAYASVGSEPIAAALSGDGQVLVVVHAADPMVALVDTNTLAVRRVPLTGVSRAVAVVGRTAFVPLFYGTVVEEGSDRGRFGKVVELDVITGTINRAISLRPITDVLPVCSPNQLAAMEVIEGLGVVAHTCVSPAPPLDADNTAVTALSVFDLVTGLEVTASTMRRLGANPMDPTRASLMANPVALLANQGRLVLLSAGANELVAFQFTQSPIGPLLFNPGTLGSGCMYDGCSPGDAGALGSAGVPSGLALTQPFFPADDPSLLGVLVHDPTGLLLRPAGPVVGTTYAVEGIDGAPSHERLMGQKFFSTAQGRWSKNQAMSCVSCHPDGLSDNVTWTFSTGPRQTIPLDGTFAHQDPADHRAQNWTGVFDEIYDVEGLTRSVMGGLGAMVSDSDAGEVRLSLSTGRSLDGGAMARSDGLSGSSRALSEGLSVNHDWVDVERFVQSVRTLKAPSGLDAASVARGRTVFEGAGCAGCHAGPKWTASRVPWQPSAEKNGSLPGDNGLPASPTGLRTELRASGPLGTLNLDTWKVAVEQVPNPAGGPDLLIGPERITCVVRAVGTFDAASALEKKADGTRAQGALGFNVPSLLGVAGSAPYLHHGAAATLEALFAPPFLEHARSGNQAFLPNEGTSADERTQLTDLVTFLRSIDGMTPPFPVAMATDLCAGY